jgi:hypothetical protein
VVFFDQYIVCRPFAIFGIQITDMGKTYTKTHETEKAVKGHVKNIKGRGGKAKVTGKKVTYSFGDKKK